MEIGLKGRDVWEEGRIETVQWSLDCTKRARPGGVSASVSSPYSLSTCPAAHCLLGEDVEHAVPRAVGLLHCLTVVLGLRVERDVKQNKIQPLGSDGPVTSASGGPERVLLLPILPKHKPCKNHSYRA